MSARLMGLMVTAKKTFFPWTYAGKEKLKISQEGWVTDVRYILGSMTCLWCLGAFQSRVWTDKASVYVKTQLMCQSTYCFDLGLVRVL